MNSSNTPTTPELLKSLGLEPELLALTSLNQFSLHNSASRSVMMLGQLSQAISLLDGDERLCQSGIETKLGTTAFNKVFKNDSKILSINHKFRAVEYNEVDADVEFTIIYMDMVTGEVEEMVIPKYQKNHNYFGFDYRYTDALLNLEYGQIVPGGTILATPRSITQDGGYKFGVNLNIALITLPEVGEDAIIISETAAKKMRFKLYETRRISFGKDILPLNLYGDDKEYKIFPDIGEYINDSGILAATREYDDMLAGSLFSDKALREPDVTFDNCIYVRGRGKVIDVNVVYTPQGQRKSFWDRTEVQVARYHKSIRRYNKSIVDTYKNIKSSYDNVRSGNKLHRHIVDILCVEDDSIKNLYRKEVMNTWTVDVTVEYELTPGNGYKLAGVSGDKGIICNVRPDNEMPKSKDGTVADIIMDPNSTIARMNVGRLYETFMNGVSRKVKGDILKMVNAFAVNFPIDQVAYNIPLDLVDSIFNYLLGCLELIGNEQFKSYAEVKDEESKREIINDIIVNDFYIWFPIDNKKPGYEVVYDIMNSVYKPLKDKIEIRANSNTVETINDITIFPMYIILLSKIADTWLSIASSKVNHFGIPIRASKQNKYRTPWSVNPTKIMSETEGRVFASYAESIVLAEIKDRANSIKTHEAVYNTILTASTPTNIQVAVDRTKIKRDGDVAMNIVKSIFKTGGLDITYVKDTSVEED